MEEKEVKKQKEMEEKGQTSNSTTYDARKDAVLLCSTLHSSHPTSPSKTFVSQIKSRFIERDPGVAAVAIIQICCIVKGVSSEAVAKCGLD